MKMTQHGYQTGLGKLLYFVFSALQLGCIGVIIMIMVNAPYDSGSEMLAAALFAVLLEIQGRGEEAITRILDVVANDDIPEMSDPAAVSRWLDSVRHRFDLALAREAKP